MPNLSDEMVDGKKNEEYLQVLQQHKAQVTTKLVTKRIPGDEYLLHHFAAEGKLAQVEAIIAYFQQDKGLVGKGGKVLTFQEAIDFLDSEYKNTALHTAAKYGHHLVVKALLKAGAIRNIQNEIGNTPLHSAAFSGYYLAVDELLAGDVNLDFVTKTNTDQYSAVRVVLDKKVISPRGVNPSAPSTNNTADFNKTAERLLDFYLKNGIPLIDEIDKDTGNTLLHLAILNGYNNDVIQKIVKLNPKLVNAQNKQGETPLILALTLNLDNKTVAAPLLIDGIDISLFDQTGSNAIHYAVQNNKLEDLKLLLAKDKNAVNKPNEEGATPLHLAAQYAKTIDFIKQLIDAGADVNAKNEEDNTPAHLAVLEGAEREWVYIALKEAHADLNIKNTKQKTVATLLEENPYPVKRIPRHHSKGERSGSVDLRHSSSASLQPPRTSSRRPSAENAAAPSSSVPPSARSEASAASSSSAAEHHALLQKQAAEQALALKEQQDRIKQRELEAALASDDRWIRTKARWQQLPLLVKSLIITAALALLLSTIIAILIFCPPIGHPFTVAMTHFLKTLLAIPARAMWVPPYAQAFAILLPEMIAAIGWSIGLLGYGAYLGLRKAYNAWFSPDQQVSVPPAVASEKPGFSYQNIVSSLEETKKAYVDPWYEEASEIASSLSAWFKGWYPKGTKSNDTPAAYTPISVSDASLQPPAEPPTVTVS